MNIIKKIWRRYRVRQYDAAQTNITNKKHFLKATTSDADAVISPALQTLRNRARYEVRNNCYAAGMVQTKANDIVGTGPRLQVKSDNGNYAKKIERLFADWCQVCDAGGRLTFGEILRLVGSIGQDESGEGLIVITRDRNPVAGLPAMRLQVIEPDRLATPGIYSQVRQLRGRDIRDGVEVDEDGRPVRYHILKNHPGALNQKFGPDQFFTVEAANVIHLYRQGRPGQTRGVPWLTPALPLFAYLRRYTLAVVAAAELAADVAGVIQSASEQLTATNVNALEEIDIPSKTLLTLPAGWEFHQVKAEQPTNTYEAFKRELLSEIARSINMPYNVAAGNSAKYNYASGRLDKQVYHRAVGTNQDWIAVHVCNRIFQRFLYEALTGPFQIPKPSAGDMAVSPATVAWYWPGAEHVDPAKEATAQKIRLENKTTTLAAEYARQGKDWESEIEQIAREKAKMDELGLAATITKGASDDEPEKENATPDQTDDDEEKDDDGDIKLAG